MRLEIATAARFLGKMLTGTSSEQKAEFEQALASTLQDHYTGHWDTERPMAGQAFRCLRCESGKSDPLLVQAATSCGVPVSRLPTVLCVWVDPGEVAARIGHNGSVFELPLEQDAVKATVTIKPAQSCQTAARSPLERDVALPQTIQA